MRGVAGVWLLRKEERRSHTHTVPKRRNINHKAGIVRPLNGLTIGISTCDLCVSVAR